MIVQVLIYSGSNLSRQKITDVFITENLLCNFETLSEMSSLLNKGIGKSTIGFQKKKLNVRQSLCNWKHLSYLTLLFDQFQAIDRWLIFKTVNSPVVYHFIIKSLKMYKIEGKSLMFLPSLIHAGVFDIHI